MIDPETTLNRLSAIVSDAASWTPAEQLAAFCAIEMNLQSLEHYAKSVSVHDRLNASGKFSDARKHLRAAFQFGDTNGFSIEQHFQWLFNAIEGLKVGLLGQGEKAKT